MDRYDELILKKKQELEIEFKRIFYLAAIGFKKTKPTYSTVRKEANKEAIVHK